MSIVELIKQYPHSISYAVGLSLIVCGLCFWLGTPQIMIAIGGLIIFVTTAVIFESHQ